MVMMHYKDDEGTNELCFQEWTQEMQDMLNARKHGDVSFHEKDFKTTINYYTQFIEVSTTISPTVYARRSLAYLCHQLDASLCDAMQEQCVYLDWTTTFYMQATTLTKINMLKDVADRLKGGVAMEENRQEARGS